MPTQGEVDRKRLIDVPLYTTWDVVRYLRVPLWLPLALQVPELNPSFSWTIDDMLGVVQQYEGVIPQDGADLSFKEVPLPRLSFRKLASLFVLSAVACPTSPFKRTSHHV